MGLATPVRVREILERIAAVTEDTSAELHAYIKDHQEFENIGNRMLHEWSKGLRFHLSPLERSLCQGAAVQVFERGDSVPDAEPGLLGLKSVKITWRRRVRYRKSREEEPKSTAKEWLGHRRDWGIGEDKLKLIPAGPV